MTNAEAISFLSQIKMALLNNNSWNENTHEPINSAFDLAIEALQARKTGKWVHLPNVWGVVFCSECNYDLRINDTKYCPYCGAKMEVDE